MIKYKAYPEYKDSGVEWIDSIPSHWDVKPTFALCEASAKKNIDGVESNVLSLSYGNIIPRDVETNFGLLPESFNTYQIINHGDVILRLTDLQNDKNSLRVGLVKQKGIITSAYLKLKAKKDMNATFLYRLLHSYDTTKVFYGMGGGLRQSMKFEDFRRLSLLLPPIAEQLNISAFLDHETAKIDKLIEKQKQLLELLEEKCQAVISHTVTKGLNPDVPMKDSGIEWLGEVPAHWEVTRAKFVSSIFVPQRNKPELNDDIGINWVTMENMRQQFITCSSQYVSNSAALSSGSKVLPKGAVIASCAGNFGIAAINEIDVIINQQLQAFQPVSISAEFLMAIVSVSKNYFELIGTAATLIYVNKEGFENLPVLIPPEYEQASICNFISDKTEKFELLINNSLHQINLLQERRTALISATVTGKIDVRDWVAPDTHEVEVLQEVTA